MVEKCKWCEKGLSLFKDRARPNGFGHALGDGAYDCTAEKHKAEEKWTNERDVFLREHFW